MILAEKMRYLTAKKLNKSDDKRIEAFDKSKVECIDKEKGIYGIIPFFKQQCWQNEH